MQEVQRGKKRKRLWWWIITVILFWFWWCWSKQFVTRQRTFIEVPPLTHADTCDVLFFTLLIRSHNLPWIVFFFCSFWLLSLKPLLASPSLSHSSLSQVNPCCFTLLAWSTFSSFCFTFFFLFHTFYLTNPPFSHTHAHIHFISHFWASVLSCWNKSDSNVNPDMSV